MGWCTDLPNPNTWFEKVLMKALNTISLVVKEDDWLPYKNKQDALSAWRKLGGIRVKVLEAYDLI